MGPAGVSVIPRPPLYSRAVDQVNSSLLTASGDPAFSVPGVQGGGRFLRESLRDQPIVSKTNRCQFGRNSCKTIFRSGLADFFCCEQKFNHRCRPTLLLLLGKICQLTQVMCVAQRVITRKREVTFPMIMHRTASVVLQEAKTRSSLLFRDERASRST